MKRLEQLPLIAEETLGGLKGGPALKKRIIEAANGVPRRKNRAFKPVLAALCVCVLLGGIFAAFYMDNPSGDPQTIHSVAAGNPSERPAMRALIDLPPGSVKLSSGTKLPEYHSLWEPKSGADFPLIIVEGRVYRLMRNPSSLPDSLLGDELGDVLEYTDEPSLSGGNSIISNTVNTGEKVYAVKDMNGAAAAAKVDGTMRVFQRVSYAGKAIIGSETLSQTLLGSANVVGMELSGVGSVTGEEAATLMETLLKYASYESASLLNSEQALLIQLDTGITVQLMVKNDKLSACASWSCPEFFEAFEKTVNK